MGVYPLDDVLLYANEVMNLVNLAVENMNLAYHYILSGRGEERVRSNKLPN